MRQRFTFSLIFIAMMLCGSAAFAQKPPVFGIHISSPTGMFYKLGVKVEYRIVYGHALLASYTSYYKYFPGFQGGLEYRMYLHDNTVHENIVYFKAGTGFADYQPSSNPFSSGKDLNKAPGTYYFGGAGVGRHWSFDFFFLEVCAGLKYSYVADPPKQYNERLFYTAGPGAIPDVHFNFGFQF